MVKKNVCVYEYRCFIVYVKKMIFIKTFHKMLKLGLILEIINYIDHWPKEKNKK